MIFFYSLLLLSGCGLKMDEVIRACEKEPSFTLYSQCIKTTYNNRPGNYFSGTKISAFYSTLGEIQESYAQGKMSEAKARANLFKVYIETIDGKKSYCQLLTTTVFCY